MEPQKPKQERSKSSDKYLSLNQDFSGMKIIHTINKSKFSVYLAQSNDKSNFYAVKVFPYNANGEVNQSYLRELQFSDFKHENLIRILDCQDKKKTSRNDHLSLSSIIVMEYAPFLDFSVLIESVNLSSDEKLIRTYFHQLINGIKYIHSQGLAHMDIKCENLLLGEDYKLKIGDYNLSSPLETPNYKHKGTPCCRAPEVMAGQTTDLAAADVYSAGVFLFVMTFRNFPYVEEKEGGEEDHRLLDLMHKEPAKFWTLHETISEVKPSKSFKELFEGMISANPKDRLKIEQIEENEWYREDIYDHDELEQIMHGKLTRYLKRRKSKTTKF